MFPGRGGRGFRGGGPGGGWRPQGPGPFSGPPFGGPGWGMGPPPGLPWGGPPRGGFRGGPRGGGPPPNRGGGFRQERKANQDPPASTPIKKKKEVEATQSPVVKSGATATKSPVKPEVKKPDVKDESIGGGAMIKCAPCGIDIIGSEVRAYCPTVSNTRWASGQFALGVQNRHLVFETEE